MSDLIKYFMYYHLELKQQLAFRLNVLFRLLEPTFSVLVQYFVWVFIFAHGFVNSSQWEISNLLRYIVAVQLAQFVFPLFISDLFSNDVRTGHLTIYVARPLFYPLVLAAKAAAYSMFQLAVILLPLVVLMVLHERNFSFAIEFITILLSASVLGFTIELIFGVLSFQFIQVNRFKKLVAMILFLLGGTYVPISFFPIWLKNIGRFSPYYSVFGAVGDFAAGHARFEAILIGQVAWTSALIAIFVLLWNRGYERYDAVN